MFRNHSSWTGVYFTACSLTSLNTSLFKNLQRLANLKFPNNFIRHIDAHFVTNAPNLRGVDTEDNPILRSIEDTCDPTFFRKRIMIGEQEVPLCWRQCPRGSFNSFNLSDECPFCPPGKFNDAQSNESTATQAICYDCPRGKYGNASGATSMLQCGDCPQGQYSDSPGDTLCEYCSPGRFSESNGTSSCSVCEAGSSSSAGDSRCAVCSAGTYSKEGGDPCTKCDAGRFSSNASTACLECEEGTYAQTGAATCTPCPEGHYGPFGSPPDCVACPVGKHLPEQGAVNKSQCQDCRRGRYSSSEGLAECLDCPKGKQLPNPGAVNLSQCQDCMAGRFSGMNGASSCFPCDAGKYVTQVGSTICFGCAAGRYSRNASAECQACEPGRYNSDWQATNDTQCVICPKGHYCDTPVATPCAAGTYSARDGANSSASCQHCEIGKFAEGGASSCSPCSAGHATDREGAASQVECVASLQEVLDMLPMLILEASLFALTCLFVLWLYCKDRKYVEEERAHKKYLVPISAVFGLFDFISDVYFAYSLDSARPAWAKELAVMFLIGPFVLSLVCLGWLTCHEIRKPKFYAWFKDHAAFASMTLMCSASNSSIFELTYCDLGGLAIFQAPWSKRALDLLVFAGLITNLLEDIPPLSILLYVATQQATTAHNTQQQHTTHNLHSQHDTTKAGEELATITEGSRTGLSWRKV